jgi:hypothetical protein
VWHRDFHLGDTKSDDVMAVAVNARAQRTLLRPIDITVRSGLREKVTLVGSDCRREGLAPAYGSVDARAGSEHQDKTGGEDAPKSRPEISQRRHAHAYTDPRRSWEYVTKLPPNPDGGATRLSCENCTPARQPEGKTALASRMPPPKLSQSEPFASVTKLSRVTFNRAETVHLSANAALPNAKIDAKR